ncbi:SMI1/KNR4 family protein [Streptomyces sp. NBC_01483]|uniref:SMI1/KNR4 family protein n=1 Tax=Streptomyces sp. NBC_01483 TaxID=2903883 RepID=UPI002E31DFC6|nr:SMI1/KNR4 family protein [Streptomyces sp. NBC_01483]
MASDFALLNPPATPDEIRQAERIIGTPLPGDLAESLQCRNDVSTWTTILPEQSPLAVSGIVDRWQTCMDVAAEDDGLASPRWSVVRLQLGSWICRVRGWATIAATGCQ